MKELKIEFVINSKSVKQNYQDFLEHSIANIRSSFIEFCDEFLAMNNAETKITITSETKQTNFFSLAEISFAFKNYIGDHNELTSIFNEVAVATKFFDNLIQEQIDLVKLHFLSQLMYESDRGKYTTEIADGSQYEGNKILGNTQKGDGKKFKGRGFIQLTGRDNYTRFSKWLDSVHHIMPITSIIQSPNIVATDLKVNVFSAFWYWQSRNITEKALEDNVYTVTKKINGGTNGLTQRALYYQMLKKFMKEGL